MAWSTDNWFRDGIINELEIEMIEPTQLGVSRGMLSGFVRGNFTFGYYTDLKVSGTIEIADADFKPNSLIRIWHKATLGNDSIRQMLATCFVSDANLEYAYGRYTGVLELSSMLLRFDGDRMHYDGGFNSGQKALEFFRYQVESQGGEVYIHPALNEKTLPVTVWEFGDPSRSRLQMCADATGAQIGVDSYGRITLTPYTIPFQRSLTFNLPKGEDSIVLTGVSVNNNIYSMPNRSVVKYTWEKEVFYGQADLEGDHPASRAKRGRSQVITEIPSTLPFATQLEVDHRAKVNLANATSAHTKYEVNMLYYPFDAIEGQCGSFEYQDSSEKGISADVMVQQIELELDFMMRQKVIFDVIRSHCA